MDGEDAAQQAGGRRGWSRWRRRTPADWSAERLAKLEAERARADADAIDAALTEKVTLDETASPTDGTASPAHSASTCGRDRLRRCMRSWTAAGVRGIERAVGVAGGDVRRHASLGRPSDLVRGYRRQRPTDARRPRGDRRRRHSGG